MPLFYSACSFLTMHPVLTSSLAKDTKEGSCLKCVGAKPLSNPGGGGGGYSPFAGVTSLVFVAFMPRCLDGPVLVGALKWG